MTTSRFSLFFAAVGIAVISFLAGRYYYYSETIGLRSSDSDYAFTDNSNTQTGSENQISATAENLPQTTRPAPFASKQETRFPNKQPNPQEIKNKTLSDEPRTSKHASTEKSLSNKHDVIASVNQQGYLRTIDDLHAQGLYATNSVAYTQLLHNLVKEYEQLLIDKKDYQGLIELYTQLTRYESQPQAYYFKLAELYYSTGDFDQALSYLYLIQYEPFWANRSTRLIAKIESIRNRAIGVVEIPLENIKNKYIATVSINSFEAKLLVDTGASISTLNPSTANQMQLETSTKTLTVHTASESVKTPIRIADTFGFNGFIIQDLKISELELPNAIGVNGLLGMDYLQHFDFVLDQDRNVLTLEWR